MYIFLMSTVLVLILSHVINNKNMGAILLLVYSNCMDIN